MAEAELKPTVRKPIRWWPAGVILVGAVASVGYVRAQSDWAFQKRNLATAQVVIVVLVFLVIWWMLFSRATVWRRFAGLLAVIGGIGGGAGLFRIRGVSGDLVPILEFRWSARNPPSAPVEQTAPTKVAALQDPTTNDFPQFLGPHRDGVLAGPRLETNWTAHPPQLIWRQTVGSARSGFVTVGGLAITLEQRGEQECVVARELATGRQYWVHADQAHYQTTIAGDGPHATPTVVSNRVFTLGGTGWLNCLDLASGRPLWKQDVVKDSGGAVPAWGCASSPLVINGLVMVQGGEHTDKSLLAYHVEDGVLAWAAGTGRASYASPAYGVLAGSPQVISFNHHSLSGHNLSDGKLLWESPWGNGNVVCAQPVLVSSNRALCSSGYGAGAQLVEISNPAPGQFAARQVWRTTRMKAKFSHLFVRDGFLYGLDDGILACVDLADGSQRWKEGRYGHGQGLLVGDLYLMMAESGELILLRPTPTAPNELGRFQVFNAKTWNPPALAGDILLVRNESEAAGLKIRVAQ